MYSVCTKIRKNAYTTHSWTWTKLQKAGMNASIEYSINQFTRFAITRVLGWEKKMVWMDHKAPVKNLFPTLIQKISFYFWLKLEISNTKPHVKSSGLSYCIMVTVWSRWSSGGFRGSSPLPSLKLTPYALDTSLPEHHPVWNDSNRDLTMNSCGCDRTQTKCHVVLVFTKYQPRDVMYRNPNKLPTLKHRR